MGRLEERGLLGWGRGKGVFSLNAEYLAASRRTIVQPFNKSQGS